LNKSPLKNELADFTLRKIQVLFFIKINQEIFFSSFVFQRKKKFRNETAIKKFEKIPK